MTRAHADAAAPAAGLSWDEFVKECNDLIDMFRKHDYYSNDWICYGMDVGVLLCPILQNTKNKSN